MVIYLYPLVCFGDMEPTLSPQTIGTAGALGARFKAGLQSVLSVLGKPAVTNPILSPTHDTMLDSLKPQPQENTVLEKCTVSQPPSADTTSTGNLEPCTAEALLADVDNDDEGHISEFDDALLEGNY